MKELMSIRLKDFFWQKPMTFQFTLKLLIFADLAKS